MKITEYLDTEKVDYQLLSHHPTFTAQRMAAADHVPGMMVAKPVIVKANGRYYMCVLPACCKVDLEVLGKQLGADRAVLADESEMAKLFPECELGAEPPFGNMFGVTTLMDQSMSGDDYIVFQAGSHTVAIQINMNDYRMLVHPQILSFGYHLH